MSTTSSDQPAFLIIGEITKPHGVRGEVRVEVLTENPERYKELEEVYIAKNERQTPQPIKLETVRFHQGKALVKLEGYNYRDEVEKLRKWLIFIPADQAIPLEDGEFFYYQLIGMQVVSDEQERLGQVVDIIQTGANDVFVVAHPEKGEILIPDTEEVVTDIDGDARLITVHIIPGLL
ncbi:MAG: ribosome maturation factor RimM [Chloroflexota bacterium]